MAVYTSINYKQPVDAGLMNEHTSEVIAPGIYKGMYIRPHSVDAFTFDIRHVPEGDDDKLGYRNDLYGLVFMPQGMRVKVTSPQYYSENDEILSKLKVEAPDSQDRIDLVYMEYGYRDMLAKDNMPEYGVIKGKPSADPVRPPIFSENEVREDEEDRYRDIVYLKNVRIPMAYITVRAGSTGINTNDIINVPRTMSGNDIYKYIHDLFHTVMGNTVLSGLNVTAASESDCISLHINQGKCLVNGYPFDIAQRSEDVTPDTGTLYEGYACSDGSARTQPRNPSYMYISIKAGDHAIPAGTKIATISGLFERGSVTDHTSYDIVAGDEIPPQGSFSANINSMKLVSVDPEGIDMSEIVPDGEDEQKPEVTLLWISPIYVCVKMKNDFAGIYYTFNKASVDATEKEALLLATVNISLSEDMKFIPEVIIPDRQQ